MRSGRGGGRQVCTVSFFSRLKDAAADGHVAGEGALLVDVVALLGELGGLEAKADVLHETHALALRGEGHNSRRDRTAWRRVW